MTGIERVTLYSSILFLEFDKEGKTILAILFSNSTYKHTYNQSCVMKVSVKIVFHDKVEKEFMVGQVYPVLLTNEWGCMMVG